MLWTSSDAKKYIKGLSFSESAKWASIANAVFKKCKDRGDVGCEVQAIRIANSKSKVIKNNEDAITELFKMKRIKWKDIETIETEEGVLIKGIPVFKTGIHREKKYDEKYIDKNMIGQFNPADDIPLQADHSDSWNSTLGWVRKLYRKGKLLLADLMLVEDNAIARWQKGLMKKWSVSINKETGKLHEISAVAFPYVKEAAIHGEVAEVGMKDYEVEETDAATKPPKREIIEIDAHADESSKNHINDNEHDEHEENIETIDWAEGIDISIMSKGTSKTTALTINGKNVKGATDVSFNMYGETVSVRYSKTKKADNGVVEQQSYEYRTPYVPETRGYSSDPTASSHALSDSPDDKARDNKALDEIAPTKKQTSLANHNEDTETNKMSDEKKVDAQESVLLKEASEREEKLAKDIKDKDEQLATLAADTKAKELEIAQFKVDSEIDDLKADGKVVPAQETKLKEFMLSLSEDARKQFVDVLKEGKPKVDLEEHSAQESNKTDNEKVDLESMSAEQIEAAVEKYAKDNGVPLGDARDIYYEKNSKKE